MKAEQAVACLADREFLDALYGFAYRRCATSQEAEDLCSDILLAALQSLKRAGEVEQVHAYVWTLARRVYADYCERRRVRSETERSGLGAGDAAAVSVRPVDDFLESEEDAADLRRILREIAFLAKAYRDVMVLHYLEGMKLSAVAARLGVPESTVKQRLFTARNTVRKETLKMETRDYSLQPVRLYFLGTGNPVGNDARGKAERLLSQNLVYLCKDEGRTAKELSERLHVPMPFIEEELDIQCRGENGSYGLLRKEDNRYLSNVLLLDGAEYREAIAVYARHMDNFCAAIRRAAEREREAILSFPYLSRQDDLRFILWCRIFGCGWGMCDMVKQRLRQEYFSAVETPERPFSLAGFALKEGEEPDFQICGCKTAGGANSSGRFAAVFRKSGVQAASDEKRPVLRPRR